MASEDSAQPPTDDPTLLSSAEGSHRAEARELPFLVRLSDPDRGQVFPLKPGPMIVGRERGCDIVIADEEISRRHAELNLHDGKLIVRDLNSTNGTFHRGKRIKTTELPLNERIQFGPDALYKFTFKDETEARYEQSLLLQATTDGLTGLFNRTTFVQRAQEDITWCHRQKHPYALAVLDVDHFKRINDTYGHPAGDAVLRRIGQVLRAELRKGDLCGRFGGEEFILFFRSTPKEMAGKLAERLRSSIASEAFRVETKSITVTISLGVFCVSMQGGAEIAFEECLQRADANLYEAKRSGRNRVELQVV